MAATLAPWQVLLYKDALTIYRIDERDRDSRGAPLGYRQVFTGELCQLHATGNFDEDGPTGQSKKDNVQTSDKATCHLSLDIRAEDIAKIVTQAGSTLWLKVAGAPKDRGIVAGIPDTGYKHFFVVICLPPTIIGGTWNG